MRQSPYPKRKMHSDPVIRQFTGKDRDAVRAICMETGQRGNPTRVFFEDEEVAAMLFADYYMQYEPESCFVAEIDGEVVGYMLGCQDRRRYVRVMATRIVPRVWARVLWRLFTFRYRNRQTYHTIWWILSRSWRETLRAPVGRYPGHAHFNMKASHRGRGVGMLLSKAFHAHARNAGVAGLSAVELEPEGDDRLSTFLCRKRGYRLLKVRRHTAWEKATGKRWYAKLLVCDLTRTPGPDDP